MNFVVCPHLQNVAKEKRNQRMRGGRANSIDCKRRRVVLGDCDLIAFVVVLCAAKRFLKELWKFHQFVRIAIRHGKKRHSVVCKRNFEKRGCCFNAVERVLRVLHDASDLSRQFGKLVCRASKFGCIATFFGGVFRLASTLTIGRCLLTIVEQIEQCSILFVGCRRLCNGTTRTRNIRRTAARSCRSQLLVRSIVKQIDFLGARLKSTNLLGAPSDDCILDGIARRFTCIDCRTTCLTLDDVSARRRNGVCCLRNLLETARRNDLFRFFWRRHDSGGSSSCNKRTEPVGNASECTGQTKFVGSAGKFVNVFFKAIDDFRTPAFSGVFTFDYASAHIGLESRFDGVEQRSKEFAKLFVFLQQSLVIPKRNRYAEHRFVVVNDLLQIKPCLTCSVFFVFVVVFVCTKFDFDFSAVKRKNIQRFAEQFSIGIRKRLLLLADGSNRCNLSL